MPPFFIALFVALFVALFASPLTFLLTPLFTFLNQWLSKCALSHARSLKGHCRSSNQRFAPLMIGQP
jgi:hypothetical protein